MSPNKTIGEQIKGAFRNLVIATVVLYVMVIGVLIIQWQDSNAKRNALHKETARVNKALCTLRQDLQHRLDASKEFLTKHPDGVPGISAETIQGSINIEQETVSSLRGLHCAPS